MKREILERYERSNDESIIINIAADRIEDLYNDFDKKSDFLKKDLNEELVNYIIESVEEIDKERFVIHFSLDVAAHESDRERVGRSINRFFLYYKELEHKKMQEMIRTSIILLLIGVVVATFSVIMNQSESVQKSVLLGVIAEGLTIAAWVSIWEALATFLIKWRPIRKKIKLYEKIANAKLFFT